MAAAVDTSEATGAAGLELGLDAVESVEGLTGMAALLELALAAGLDWTGTITTVDTPEAVTVVPALVEPMTTTVGVGDCRVRVMRVVEVERTVVVASPAALELSTVAVTVVCLVVRTVRVWVVVKEVVAAGAGEEFCAGGVLAAGDELGAAAPWLDLLALGAGDTGIGDTTTTEVETGTGTTVVETGTTEVVTFPTGQLVTAAAQLVMV